jgi:hypothetical protein
VKSAGRKPLAITRKVGLFDHKVTVGLSQPALELLFDGAEVLAEGERRGPSYLGSTMITLDLARLAAIVHERCDLLSAREVARLITQDSRVRSRARELTLADAHERAGVRPARAQLELRARAVGARVFLDIDVEAELEAEAAAERTP